jgi:hypothetical protein
MRYALVLTAAALLACGSAVAADPPITFQTHPLDRALGDVRGAADLIGGEKAVRAFNKSIEDKLGEKGFEGLDLGKPVVGYVTLAPKPADTVAVIVFPVTTEKEFLGLCARWNRGEKPKDLGKGVYELPPLEPFPKALMKFSDGHAYIAAGINPEKALDDQALVSANKLYDPAERGVFAGKLHFDRIPADVKKALPGLLADLKKGLDADHDPFTDILKAGLPDVEKMVARYLILLGGADTLTLRVGVDVPTSDLVVEATLAPKPDTLLAKAIEGRKPTANQFAALLGPDTAVGFKTRLPFFNEELKAATTKVLEAGQRSALENTPEANKAMVEELFKGLIRTVKTGEADVVAGVRGPDKGGDFTLVGAVAFEDPSGLEKEFRKYVEKKAPANEQERFKWEAAKVGTVTVHTYKLENGGFFDISKPFGMDKATLAFAFAPKGVFFVLGPDPMPLMKDALAVKPVDSPVLDVVVNPARLAKLVERGGGMALDVEKALGREDKLLSAMGLHVTGGKELTVRYTLNLRLIPRALVNEFNDAQEPPDDQDGRTEPTPPAKNRRNANRHAVPSGGTG